MLLMNLHGYFGQGNNASRILLWVFTSMFSATDLCGNVGGIMSDSYSSE